MTITDGADSASLRIDRYTDIDGQPQAEPRADIIGIVSQYDTSDPYLSYYQLMPRMYDDFNWLPSGIDDNDILPQDYSLAQNYPNPFNPSTNLEFSMKNTGHVLITIYNLLGQKVSVVADAEFPAGKHTVEWDGTDYDGQKVTSGIYLYRMEAGDFSDAKKMIVLK
jgi:hypothetical protein